MATKEFCGIPVLQHGDTVRYLGYAVGTGHLTDANWAARIRNVQRRLATATQLATSVETRVLLFNVIVLPAVLFTAAVFETHNIGGTTAAQPSEAISLESFHQHGG